MSFLTQIQSLLTGRRISLTELSSLLGMARSNLSATLSGKYDPRGATLEALASGLDAEWVLVPKEHLYTVRQVLDGKGIGADLAAESAAELYMRGRR